MNKEFIQGLRKHLDWEISYYTQDLIGEDGYVRPFAEEHLKYYAFIKRVVESVITPLQNFLPEKEGEKT